MILSGSKYSLDCIFSRMHWLVGFLGKNCSIAGSNRHSPLLYGTCCRSCSACKIHWSSISFPPSLSLSFQSLGLETCFGRYIMTARCPQHLSLCRQDLSQFHEVIETQELCRLYKHNPVEWYWDAPAGELRVPSLIGSPRWDYLRILWTKNLK